MTASKPASRRRAPRLTVERPGRLKGRLPHAIVVIDVSLTGCLVRCGTLLKSGAILDFEMDLDDGPVSSKVRVAEASVDGVASGDPGQACLAGL
jgi:PilZ domain